MTTPFFACEWVYVVDLDNEVLEVLEGCVNKEEAESKGFNDVGGERDLIPRFVKSFSFHELPTTEEEFIEVLSKIVKARKRESGEDWEVNDV